MSIEIGILCDECGTKLEQPDDCYCKECYEKLQEEIDELEEHKEDNEKITDELEVEIVLLKEILKGNIDKNDVIVKDVYDHKEFEMKEKTYEEILEFIYKRKTALSATSGVKPNEVANE